VMMSMPVVRFTMSALRRKVSLNFFLFFFLFFLLLFIIFCLPFVGHFCFGRLIIYLVVKKLTRP
jgi:hypothetical protein